MIVGTFYDLDEEGRLHGYSRSDGLVPIQPGLNTSKSGWEVVTVGGDPCYYWGSMPNCDDVARCGSDFNVRAVIEATGEATDVTAGTIRVLGVVDPLAQLGTRWGRFSLLMGRDRNFTLALAALTLLTSALTAPFVFLFPDVTPSAWLTVALMPMFFGGRALMRASLRGESLRWATDEKGLPERVEKLAHAYPDVTVHATVEDLIATYPPTLHPERAPATPSAHSKEGSS